MGWLGGGFRRAIGFARDLGSLEIWVGDKSLASRVNAIDPYGWVGYWRGGIVIMGWGKWSESANLDRIYVHLDRVLRRGRR